MSWIANVISQRWPGLSLDEGRADLMWYDGPRRTDVADLLERAGGRVYPASFLYTPVAFDSGSEYLLMRRIRPETALTRVVHGVLDGTIDETSTTQGIEGLLAGGFPVKGLRPRDETAEMAVTLVGDRLPERPDPGVDIYGFRLAQATLQAITSFGFSRLREAATALGRRQPSS